MARERKNTHQLTHAHAHAHINKCILDTVDGIEALRSKRVISACSLFISFLGTVWQSPDEKKQNKSS